MIPISQMKTMTVRREERNPDTIKQKAKGCNRAKKNQVSCVRAQVPTVPRRHLHPHLPPDPGTALLAKLRSPSQRAGS